jgi:hypothetical protein
MRHPGLPRTQCGGAAYGCGSAPDFDRLPLAHERYSIVRGHTSTPSTENQSGEHRHQKPSAGGIDLYGAVVVVVGCLLVGVVEVVVVVVTVGVVTVLVGVVTVVVGAVTVLC